MIHFGADLLLQVTDHLFHVCLNALVIGHFMPGKQQKHGKLLLLAGELLTQRNSM